MRACGNGSTQTGRLPSIVRPSFNLYSRREKGYTRQVVRAAVVVGEGHSHGNEEQGRKEYSKGNGQEGIETRVEGNVKGGRWYNA